MPVYPTSCSINGGDEMPLESLGLSLDSLELHNMQADVANLTWTRARAGIPCPVAFDDVVDVFLSGRRIFQGRARLGSIGQPGGPVKLLGPWSHLEETTWQFNIFGSPIGPKLGDVYEQTIAEDQEFWDGTTWQPGPFTISWTVDYFSFWDPGSPGVGTLDICLGWLSRGWLYAPVGGIEGFRTLASQFAILFQFFEHVRAPAQPFTVGAVDLGPTQRPKMRTVQDLYLSDAVRQSLTSKPDVALWWEYGDHENVPVLRARVAGSEPVMSLRVQEPQDGVLDYRLQPMPHLVPSGVVVRWERPAASTENTGLAQPYFADRWPEDLIPYAPRTLIQSVAEEGNPYAGFAKELYDSLSVLRCQGTLRIRDLDLSRGLRPGCVIDLVGDAELSGVQTWVQSVTWTPGDGVATCAVGYPAHLGLRERMDLRKWKWNAFYGPNIAVKQVL